MVAAPETVGVQLKTCSGALPPPQLPARALLPLVVPVSVPPAAGTMRGLLHDTDGDGMTTGTVATLLLLSRSGIRSYGSTVTRRVSLPGATPVMSRYWQ